MIRTPAGTTSVGGGATGAVPRSDDRAELHLIVRVGPERFAFPVAALDEVVDAPVIAWVPRAREGLLGELLHRDRTVSAYDAAWAFDVPRPPGAGTALVLRDDEARVALVVDDVDDLLLIEQGSVQPVPAGPDAAGLLRGIRFVPGDGRGLLGLVRVDALLARVGRRGSARSANVP